MRASRWWDPLAVVLLLLALLTAASRLVATEWVAHLGVAQGVVLLGLVLGLALGYSTFAPVLAGLFAVLYGLFVIPWQLGITVGRISDQASWSGRLIVLSERLVHTLRQFLQREPVQDPALFLFLTAILAWTLSVHAAYVLVRHARPWQVIVPTGVATLMIQVADRYVPSRAWYLAAYLVFAMLLLARLTYLHLRTDWTRGEARIPPLMALDLSYVTLAVTVVLVLLAWTVPTIAEVMPTAREAWQRSTRPVAERLDSLFASLRRRGPVLRAADYYGGTFSLGQGRELTDALVLGVQGTAADKATPRYYWRARVYDHYADGEWSSAALTDTQKVDRAGFGQALPELRGRETITFAYTSPDPLVTLFAASQPLWASKPAEVLLAENPDGTVDIAAFRADPPLSPGETYLARSSASAVTRRQLRSAGTEYPYWITDRYLQLPPTITPRTRQLAQELSAGLDTPYDVATIITEYLRLQIRYSETITDSIPDDQEPLDWFLFDLQVGYCNYYASAQVVMLRSLGIPARLAVGFAEGERRGATDTYLVHQKDAHAWPEVYFPGLGWIEFEPTVSQARLTRPAGEEGPVDDASSADDPSMGFRDRLEEMLAEEDVGESLEEGADAGSSVERSPWTRRAVVLMILGMLTGVTIWWRRRQPDVRRFPILLEKGMRRLGWQPPAVLRRSAQRAMLSPVERAYTQVDRALIRLGADPVPADTAAERAATLAGLLPAALEPTCYLLSAYHAAVYGRHPFDPDAAQKAARDIRVLSWRARLRQLHEALTRREARPG